LFGLRFLRWPIQRSRCSTIVTFATDVEYQIFIFSLFSADLHKTIRIGFSFAFSAFVQATRVFESIENMSLKIPFEN
jgi:hypothetical protein